MALCKFSVDENVQVLFKQLVVSYLLYISQRDINIIVKDTIMLIKWGAIFTHKYGLYPVNNTFPFRFIGSHGTPVDRQLSWSQTNADITTTRLATIKRI